MDRYTKRYRSLSQTGTKETFIDIICGALRNPAKPANPTEDEETP